ncbi:VOC family protein [Nocardia sp. NPDC051750]|uniref:VOC family protein n=1 Tax=Nocardia sp. NPDC051750 TaxID=3364325 RepID=UPI0037AF2B0D
MFTPEAEKVRAFLRDVLELDSIDAGGGWPIFAMPPAELPAHPAETTSHGLYLMCEDIEQALAELRAKGVGVSAEITDEGWGLPAAIEMPDGSALPIYQPRHPSPPR